MKLQIELSQTQVERLDRVIRAMPGHWNPEGEGVRATWAAEFLNDATFDREYKLIHAQESGRAK